LLIGGLIGWLVFVLFRAEHDLPPTAAKIMREAFFKKTVGKSPRRTGAGQAEIDHEHVSSADKALREHKSNR